MRNFPFSYEGREPRSSLDVVAMYHTSCPPSSLPVLNNGHELTGPVTYEG